MIASRNTGKYPLHVRLIKRIWPYSVRLVCLLAVCAIVVSGCNGGEKKDSDTDKKSRDDKAVVAVVNGEQINFEKLRIAVERVCKGMDRDTVPEPRQDPKMWRGALYQLIDEALMLQESLKAGITVDEAELEQEIKLLVGDYSPGYLNLVLQNGKLTLEEWKSELRKNLKIKKLVKTEVDRDIALDEKELKSYYESHKEEFRQPEQIRAQQIVVENEAEAFKIRKELKAGAAFSDIAAKKSMSPDAKSGGDIGYFARGELPKEFDDALFNLSPKEISEVVHSPYGYHIFKLIGRSEPRLMSYDEAKPSITKLLWTERHEEAFTSWLDSLKRRSTINIVDPRFKQ